MGGNRAACPRGRNRNSRPEPTPQAALAGFLGPARMAGGSIGLEECQGWGERASARRSPGLSVDQKRARQHCRDHRVSTSRQGCRRKLQVADSGSRGAVQTVAQIARLFKVSTKRVRREGLVSNPDRLLFIGASLAVAGIDYSACKPAGCGMLVFFARRRRMARRGLSNADLTGKA